MLAALAAAAAWAADAPIVIVQPDRLIPERLEVGLGERVIWREGAGRLFRLEFDPHPSGHEVVVSAGEVRASFRIVGEHPYTVTVQGGARRRLRGLVSVRDGQPEAEQLLICGPNSSVRICFEP